MEKTMETTIMGYIGTTGREKKMETSIMGYRDYYKDPLLHS